MVEGGERRWHSHYHGKLVSEKKEYRTVSPIFFNSSSF